MLRFFVRFSIFVVVVFCFLVRTWIGWGAYVSTPTKVSLHTRWRAFAKAVGLGAEKVRSYIIGVVLYIRGIPHEGPNPSFEPKSKFLWNHRDSKFLRNSQKLLRFQVLPFHFAKALAFLPQD